MRKTPRQVMVNSRTYATSCGRCAALMLPNASVCRACGGFAVDYDRRVDYDRVVVEPVAQPWLEEAAPAYARPNPERLSTILGCWPFGPAEASDSPTISLVAEPTARAPFDALVAHRSDLPTQRRETESVPPVGPNPFLSAARMMQAREAAEAV